MFHFKDANDIARCRAFFETRYPEAFGLSVGAMNLVAQHYGMNRAAMPDRAPLGETYVIHKIQTTQNDIQPYPFFTY